MFVVAAATEMYTLSLHDALPIYGTSRPTVVLSGFTVESISMEPKAAESVLETGALGAHIQTRPPRSEEHTSELQSPCNLVCRLLLEKKKKRQMLIYMIRKKLQCW